MCHGLALTFLSRPLCDYHAVVFFHIHTKTTKKLHTESDIASLLKCSTRHLLQLFSDPVPPYQKHLCLFIFYLLPTTYLVSCIFKLSVSTLCISTFQKDIYACRFYSLSKTSKSATTIKTARVFIFFQTRVKCQQCKSITIIFLICVSYLYSY